MDAIDPSSLPPIRTVSKHMAFGGVQGFYRHVPTTIGLPMRFAVYVPPQAQHRPVPVVFYLAGLTCNEETFPTKASAQQVAAELGLMLVAPDTSPRGTGVEGADAKWDFGTAASFYLDATTEPWNERWKMETYLTQDLFEAIFANFPAADRQRVGVFGHSMGGHGALTMALRHPDLFRSVSAFAPVCAPMHCPWGVKAFSGYLGDDRARWAEHDATALIDAGARTSPILIDQGMADSFLAEQLDPERFEDACARADQPLTLRRHDGYDHGYYFVSTFIRDHLKHHSELLHSS